MTDVPPTMQDSTPATDHTLPVDTPTMDAPRPERRIRPRRSAAAQRAQWMSSRARNAARRVPLIAGVGGGAVVATLLALVLLPREADRVSRARIDAIPATTDTAPLLRHLEQARAVRSAAEASLQAAQRTAPASAVRVALELPVSVDTAIALRDSASLDLQARVARARSAPLVESYRSLAESRLLRDDARIRTIVDSLDQVDREREAYAALGGPDARYAALSAQMTALGQRAIRIADAVLQERLAVERAVRVSAARESTTAVATTSEATVLATAPAVQTATPGGAAVPTPMTPSGAAMADSSLSAAQQIARDSVAALEAALTAMRDSNAMRDSARARLRGSNLATIPPLAMLAAALVVGFALGYAVAVLRELRRPTVGDLQEIERVTQSRVVMYEGASRALRDTRVRRRSDRDALPVLDQQANSWQQLHLTLTGHGDVAPAVHVASDQVLVADALAINLAAAAARESRAVLLMELPARTPMLAVLLRMQKPRGIRDVRAGRAELREVITEVAVGRDAAVDVLFAGGDGAAVRAGVVTDNANGGTNDAAEPAFAEQLSRITARYDLTIFSGDAVATTSAHDMIVCAKLGVTPLAWLSRTVAEARNRGVRLRAVLLWATDNPTV